MNNKYLEKRLEEFEETLRFVLNDYWYDRTPLEKQRVVDELFSTSIHQAIAEERARMWGEIDGETDKIKGGKIPWQSLQFTDCINCGQEINREWVDNKCKEIYNQALDDLLASLDKPLKVDKE